MIAETISQIARENNLSLQQRRVRALRSPWIQYLISLCDELRRETIQLTGKEARTGEYLILAWKRSVLFKINIYALQ